MNDNKYTEFVDIEVEDKELESETQSVTKLNQYYYFSAVLFIIFTLLILLSIGTLIFVIYNASQKN